jgi:FkbM family methyltransferase
MLQALTLNGVSKLYLNESRNDLWAREIVFPERRDGYFVEAGAGNGIIGSSCYLLERNFGWRGICIEPHDQQFSQLVRNRPHSIHENVCLAAQNGRVEFAVASNGMSPYLSGVRTPLADHKWQGDRVLANARMVIKEAATLGHLLRLHEAPRQIDYGAFDIEGSELEAMRGFPFDEYRFLALSFEVDRAIREPLSDLLRGHGYRRTANPFNTDCPWEHYWLHESIADGHALVG